jgi:hypothetical protein
VVAWIGESQRGVTAARLALPAATSRTPYDRLGDYVPWMAGAIVALLALAVPILSCQDNTPAQPIVVVTPQPVRGVIAQTSFSGFQSGVWVSIEIIVSQRGEVDGSVDWTFSDTWMYVYFGSVKCSYSQLASNACPFLISSETQTPKPRTFKTGLLDPGTYYLVLQNVAKDNRLGIGSDNTEAVGIQLGLTVFPFTSAPGGAVKLGRIQTISPPRP